MKKTFIWYFRIALLILCIIGLFASIILQLNSDIFPNGNSVIRTLTGIVVILFLDNFVMERLPWQKMSARLKLLSLLILAVVSIMLFYFMFMRR